ncbi:stage VI sporulation protein D [Siminovitchia sp. 179-K 8D1 HS]|uniref:stage VI sporulation protein D n=1 Tax=Siminovitchia sp. 179-K 8D1 HS TaxID=3142385 RepID=UPI00399FB9BE
MPDQQQSSIKFSLEESVLFQSGQEVDELISISLDPNISIFEEDDFVFLRGHLGLTGEYKPVESGDEEDRPSDDKVNFIQVREGKEGDFVFSHPFPVDITIPKERVSNVDELFVEVESFDYELPENSRLQIEAEVLVYGLYDAQAGDQIMDDGDEAETLPFVDKHEEESHIEEESEESKVEIQLQHADEEAVESVNRNDSKDEDDHHAKRDDSKDGDDHPLEESNSLFKPFTAEARSISESDEPSAQLQHHPSFPFPFPVLPEMDIDELAMRAKKFFKEMEKNAESSSSPVESPGIIEETSSHESSSHESSDKEEPESKEKSKKKKGKYHTMSFADFFGRKEDEEPAKIKVCLVQQGDSIERLADKYDVSVQQILRANRLDSAHELQEGQVLYIPDKTAYRK